LEKIVLNLILIPCNKMADYTYVPVMIFGLAIVVCIILLVVVVGDGGCNRITAEGTKAFCGCGKNSTVTIDDIKFDGTSPVTGFFYRMSNASAAQVVFPDDKVIDLYKDDERFTGETRNVTSSMVWWMDRKGVSHWVSGAEIYTDLINKCYKDENPVTEYNEDNNRHDWTIELSTSKIEEAIKAMEDGTFRYGKTIYRDVDGDSGIDDLGSWKCCS
jgi:hypothetical protein